VFIFRNQNGSASRKVWETPACINPLKAKCNLFYIRTQSVPRSKHSVSAIKTSQLMLYREIIAVCSEIHMKHINGMSLQCRTFEC
jgi:hypothetical protein